MDCFGVFFTKSSDSEENLNILTQKSLLNFFSEEKVLRYFINMVGINEEFTTGYLLNIFNYVSSDSLSYEHLNHICFTREIQQKQETIFVMSFFF